MSSASPKRESKKGRTTPKKKNGSIIAAPDLNISNAEDPEHLRDESGSDAMDEHADAQSETSSKKNSSTKETPAQRKAKAIKAAAAKAAAESIPGPLADPELTDIRLETVLDELFTGAKQGEATAHYLVTLMMEMITGLTQSDKPVLIRERFISTFIDKTLEKFNQKNIRKFLNLLLTEVLVYNQNSRHSATAKSNTMYSMLSCAIRLCICSNAGETASEEALDAENKRYKRISSNGTKLMTVTSVVNDTTDMPELVRTLKFAEKARKAWHKTLRFKFKKKGGKMKTYCVYDYPQYCEDQEVVKYALNNHDFAKSAYAFEACLSIYKAVESSLHKDIRNRLLLYQDKIGHCGPKLILVLFKLLHTNNEDTLRIASHFFAKIEATMKEGNYNVIDMAVVIMENLIDLKNAGGNILAIHEQVTQAFAMIPSVHFQTYHNQFVLTLSNSQDGTSVLEYLQAATGWVKTLITQEKWSHSKGTTISSKSFYHNNLYSPFSSYSMPLHLYFSVARTYPLHKLLMEEGHICSEVYNCTLPCAI